MTGLKNASLNLKVKAVEDILFYVGAWWNDGAAELVKTWTNVFTLSTILLSITVSNLINH